MRSVLSFPSALVLSAYLARKADCTVKDKDGLTPLALAVKTKRKEIIQLLRKHGVEEQGSGESNRNRTMRSGFRRENAEPASGNGIVGVTPDITVVDRIQNSTARLS